jgi:hypothetical protein
MTIEYYSATKKNKILPFATAWVNLEILSEISQAQKDKHSMIPLIGKCL